MKIAIIGPSCSGKTKTAQALAEMLHCPVRLCGKIVRQKANEMGYTSLSQLTSDDHWLVDAESRVVVSVTDRIVIEGRFLNFVLAGVPDVWLIALTCDDEIRAERHRIGEEFGLERYNAKEHDRDDARLRRMLYNDERRLYRVL